MAHYGVRGHGAEGDGSWGRRAGTNVVREFDDFDNTPYGGGYDITQVYGPPVPPSEETCYPITRAPHTAGKPRPSTYGDGSWKAQEAHAYGGSAGGFGKPSHPQPQPAYGFHPHQEVPIGDGRSEFGYGGSAQPTVDYGFRPGAHKPGGYEQRPSGLGYGYTNSGPSWREEASHGYGYGHDHHIAAANPAAGYGPGRGHGEGTGYSRQQDHGHRSGYMEPVHGPVSSFGREPPTYRQVEQRQSSYGTYQGERFGSSKYDDDMGAEEKKHYHQKHRHHH